MLYQIVLSTPVMYYAYVIEAADGQEAKDIAIQRFITAYGVPATFHIFDVTVTERLK